MGDRDGGGDMGDRTWRHGFRRHGRHPCLPWETGIGDMGDRDKRLRNVVFDILTRTTTYWDINRTTKKANVHKNMFFISDGQTDTTTTDQSASPAYSSPGEVKQSNIIDMVMLAMEYFCFKGDHILLWNTGNHFCKFRRRRGDGSDA